MKTYKWLFILFVLINLGCYPQLYNDIIHTSIFIMDETQKKSVDNFRYNSGPLPKEWTDYSVEYTPEQDRYTVKVYNSDLNVLSALITYKDFNRLVKEGPAKFWKDNKALLMEGHYDNNLMTGEWKYYNVERGYLEKIGAYKNDIKVGKWVEYDENGIILKEIAYQDSLKEINIAYSGIESILSDQYAGFERKLAGCNLSKTENSCTIKKLKRWQGKIKKHIIKNKIFRPIEAIVSLEINKSGAANLSFVRSVNENIRDIILKEFQREKFIFHPSDKEDSLFLKL